tara:strand:- start:2428 stop:2868 length:441 start_codon:yes stop_codon:yes gene_type:complete
MDFDDSWIDNFDQSSNKRQWTLKIYYFYIDKDRVLQKINQDIIEIKDGILTRDELVKLIMRNRKKYTLINILSYIVNNVDHNTNYSSFFNEIEIENINFNNSDRIFESTNSLFFIFKEPDKKRKENTTKRVRLVSSYQTRRKQHKE